MLTSSTASEGLRRAHHRRYVRRRVDPEAQAAKHAEWQRAYQRRRYAKKRDQILAYSRVRRRKYYQKNKEIIKLARGLGVSMREARQIMRQEQRKAA